MKLLKIAKVFLKWVTIIGVSLLVLLLLFMEGFDRYLSTERGAGWLYRDAPVDQLDVKYTSSGIRYLKLGDTTKTPLLLIHGAPGSLFDWKNLAEQDTIYDKYYLLIPERPGYGGTRPRKAEKSIAEQANRLAEVLTEENAINAVVMGHSYGGPIAVIMGAIIPDRIDHIYGLSGQYDPDNEIIFRISYFLRYQVFKYILPRMIWVSNVEKLAHPDAQSAIIDYYSEVEVPVTLVHGDEDTLVPYENSVFLMKKLDAVSASLITLEGHNHPIHMQIPEYLALMLMKEETE